MYAHTLYITHSYSRPQQFLFDRGKAPSTPATMPEQHCRMLQYKSNDSFDKVECCSDTVAVFLQQCRTKFRPFDKVETDWTCSICFDVVERSKFRSTLLPNPATMSKQTFDFVERIVRLVAFDNVASTLWLVWTGLKGHCSHNVGFTTSIPVHSAG